MAKCDKCGIVGFFQVGIGSTHAFTDASCGVACGGRIVADTPEAPKDPYAGMTGNNHLGQLAGSGMRQHAQLQASVMAQQAAMQGQNLNAQAAWNQMAANQQMGQNTGALTDFDRGEAFAKDELARADARASRLEAELAESNNTGSLLRARVIELRAELDHRNSFSDLETRTRNELHTRANKLSDECGALKTQNTELLAENARLRRR